MPFGNYENWDDCISKNQNKSNPEAYCGKIKHQVEDIIKPECLVKAYKHYSQKHPDLSKRELLDMSFQYFQNKQDFIEDIDETFTSLGLDMILWNIAQDYEQQQLTYDAEATHLQKQFEQMREYEKSRRTPEAQALLEAMGGSLRPPVEQITLPYSVFNSETGQRFQGNVVKNLERNTTQLTPVSSSNVRGVGQFKNELLVQFRGNDRIAQRTYRYTMESPEMAEEAYRSLTNSSSPGRWIWENVRGHRKGEATGIKNVPEKYGPALQPYSKTGKKVIGGTTASLVEYRISNRVPVRRVSGFQQVDKQMARKTPNPSTNPNTGSPLEGVLHTRRGFRDQGLNQLGVAHRVRQLTKMDFKIKLVQDSNEEGRWITLHGDPDDPEEAGVHIFIKKGQSVKEAIKQKYGHKQESKKEVALKKEPHEITKEKLSKFIKQKESKIAFHESINKADQQSEAYKTITHVYNSLPRNVKDSISKVTITRSISRSSGVQSEACTGFFNFIDNSLTVALESNKGEEFDASWLKHVVAHESAHALYYNKLSTDDRLKLNQLFLDEKKKNPNFKDTYASTNVMEFFAEGYANAFLNDSSETFFENMNNNTYNYFKKILKIYDFSEHNGIIFSYTKNKKHFYGIKRIPDDISQKDAQKEVKQGRAKYATVDKYFKKNIQLTKMDFKIKLVQDNVSELIEWVLAKKLTNDKKEAKEIAFAIINSNKKKSKERKVEAIKSSMEAQAGIYQKEQEWEQAWSQIQGKFTKEKKRRSIQITDKDKQKVAELREKYGFRSIISPTAWKRDKPFPDKSYTEYLQEQQEALESESLYQQNRRDVSEYLNQTLLNPKEFIETGQQGTYKQYIASLQKQIEPIKEQIEEQFEKARKERKEKEKKERNIFLENIEKAKTSEALLEYRKQFHGPFEIGYGTPLEKYEKKLEELRKKEISEALQAEKTDQIVKKWNKDSYALLKHAIGSNVKETSEELTSGYIINLAEITGSDPTYGLKRSWLGETEWSRSGRSRKTTYSSQELDRLPLGTMVERKDRDNTKIYRKLNASEWSLIAENQGYYNKIIYGVTSQQKVSNKSQQELKILVESSEHQGTRLNALKKITDRKFLEQVATSDENYRIISAAYNRIKEMNPEDPLLEKLRSFYQSAKREDFIKMHEMIEDSLNELHEWIQTNLHITDKEDIKAVGFAIVNSKRKKKKDEKKEDGWKESWKAIGEIEDKQRLARARQQYREYKTGKEQRLQRTLYAPYQFDTISLEPLTFTIRDVSYTYDTLDLTEFQKVTHDFEHTDFTILEGPITRAGPFPYKIGGHKVTLYKQWDNLKNVFSKLDYIPFIGSQDLGAHYADTLGFAYNFKFDEDHKRVYADIITFEDMDKLTGNYKPDMEGWEVSIGFEDHREGQSQIIDRVDHLAGSLQNKEIGRCRYGGDPCYINYKNQDQNLKEVVSHSRN